MEIDVRDERRVHLGGIAREEGEAFIYEYDLGDSWRHQVLVEKARLDAGDAEGASCLGGSNYSGLMCRIPQAKGSSSPSMAASCRTNSPGRIR